MSDLDILRSVPIFADVAEDRLRQTLNEGEIQEVKAGTEVIRQGQDITRFYVILSGSAEVLRHMDGQAIPTGHHEAPSFMGEIQLLTEEPVQVAVVATADCRILTLPDDRFRALLADSRSFARCIYRSMGDRLSGFQRMLVNREKMASLGTLSAGLADELTAPASAIERAASVLGQNIGSMHADTMTLASSGLTEECLEIIRTLSEARRPDGLVGAGNPMFEGEREEAFEDWLDGHGVPEPWSLAPALSHSGVDLTQLDALSERLSPEGLAAALRWVMHCRDCRSLVDQARTASQRISDLVRAVKSYSHVDEAAKQQVDLHDGIEDTLTILQPRFKVGVNVTRDYDRSLPQIDAFGSELNQVWTHLIDNAVDAMDGRGDLRIRTARDGDMAVVEIADSGRGIPDELKSRIFDPFFTTKPAGQGTGLGLDIAHRTVRIRHRGTITFQSGNGQTVFRVRLPLPA